MPRQRKSVGFQEARQADYDPGFRDELPKTPPKREKLKLSDGGRIVIPAAMREEMGVAPGETLVAHVENGELRVRSWLKNLKRIQAELSALKKPDESVVDGFLKERREEQRRSDKRFDRLHEEGMAMRKASE